MDFSITTLFVVPVGNTLPSAGSTENLTDGQFGIFTGTARTIATAGNVGGVPFIELAQGRPGYQMGSKRSDRIQASKVKEFYKVVGHPTAANEVWELGTFSALQGDVLSLTVQSHSTFIDTTSYNGLVQSVTVNMPCIADGQAAAVVANEAIIDLFMAKIQQTISQQDTAANAVRLDTYLTFEKIGTGSSAVIRITSKPVTKLGYVVADLNTRNVDFDRVWFRAFVYKGAQTTIDFLVWDRCHIAAVATLIQRSSFPTGSSEMVKQLEVDYYSYQAKQKHLFRNVGYNQQFESFVTDGTVYDLYYIKFDELATDSRAFASAHLIDERAVIAVPQGASATIESILTTYIGTITDESGAAITTTTTTSTSSTTTTSTTVAEP